MSETPCTVVAKAYVSLLSELSADSVAWRDGGSKVLARELLDDARQDAPRVARYAGELLALVQEALLQAAPAALRQGFKAATDVTARPRESFLAVFRHLPADQVVYKTMSHYFTAGEMVALLETGHPDALSYASDMLRVARDILARRN